MNQPGKPIGWGQPGHNVATGGVSSIDGAAGAFTTGGASPGQIDIGDAEDVGTAETLARADHTHAFPAPAGAPPAVGAGAAGTATTPARSDHTHDGVASIDGNTGARTTGSVNPAQIDIGDANSLGTSGTLARADHQHAFPAPAGAPPAVGTGAAGTATTPARSDHTHDGVASLNGSTGAILMFDKLIEADQMESPVSSDWPVTGLATAQADTVNSAEIVRGYIDSSEQGAGFSLFIPPGATNLILDFTYWPETAPGATQTAGLKLYARRMTNNTAIGAWVTKVLADLSIPANRRPQIASQTIALASFSAALVAGELVHFELTRVAPGAGTVLVGDLLLRAIRVRAS